jgi:hypothetical protein
MKNDGGTAFPQQRASGRIRATEFPNSYEITLQGAASGMTVRQVYAKAAMQALIPAVISATGALRERDIAEAAHTIADNMLAFEEAEKET